MDRQQRLLKTVAAFSGNEAMLFAVPSPYYNLSNARVVVVHNFRGSKGAPYVPAFEVRVPEECDVCEMVLARLRDLLPGWFVTNEQTAVVS